MKAKTKAGWKAAGVILGAIGCLTEIILLVCRMPYALTAVIFLIVLGLLGLALSMVMLMLWNALRGAFLRRMTDGDNEG